MLIWFTFVTLIIWCVPVPMYWVLHWGRNISNRLVCTCWFPRDKMLLTIHACLLIKYPGISCSYHHHFFMVHLSHYTTAVAQRTLQIFNHTCHSFILLSLPPLLSSDLGHYKYWKCACYDWPIHWEIIMLRNFIKDRLLSYCEALSNVVLPCSYRRPFNSVCVL